VWAIMGGAMYSKLFPDGYYEWMSEKFLLSLAQSMSRRD
jgi:hypothetical protein